MYFCHTQFNLSGFRFVALHIKEVLQRRNIAHWWNSDNDDNSNNITKEFLFFRISLSRSLSLSKKKIMHHRTGINVLLHSCSRSLTLPFGITLHSFVLCFEFSFQLLLLLLFLMLSQMLFHAPKCRHRYYTYDTNMIIVLFLAAFLAFSKNIMSKIV